MSSTQHAALYSSPLKISNVMHNFLLDVYIRHSRYEADQDGPTVFFRANVHSTKDSIYI